MKEKKIYFGCRSHTVCGDYTLIRSINLLCTLLATFTVLNAMVAFPLCAIPIFTVAALCYKYEEAKWFDDSNLKFTNTLYIVHSFCSTVLLQIAVMLIINAL